MQTNLSCHIQYPNTQDILHQMKFYLEVRRSYVPEKKYSKFQQLAEEGDRRNRAQEQQEHEFEQ
jgi:hypothetical protein